MSDLQDSNASQSSASSKPFDVFRSLTPIRRLAGVLFIFALIIGVVGYLVDLGVLTVARPLQILITGFYANISTDLASIVFAILVLDALNERHAVEQEKRRLILQMGSPDNTFAREAARQLGAEGWLKDGSARKAVLMRANLQQTPLDEADLQEAVLHQANLVEASLTGAKLQRTMLNEADLHKADLSGADLAGASVAEANLQEARLNGANLSGAFLFRSNLSAASLRDTILVGADLSNANLRGVSSLKVEQLKQAKSLAGMILPEGTQLPHDERWRTALDEWNGRAFINRKGFIVPTSESGEKLFDA